MAAYVKYGCGKGGWAWSLGSETKIKRIAIITFIFGYPGFKVVYGQFIGKIGVFNYFVCKMGMDVVGGQGVVTEIRDHV